jgi:hypothetical protein
MYVLYSLTKYLANKLLTWIAMIRNTSTKIVTPKVMDSILHQITRKQRPLTRNVEERVKEIL